VARSQACSMALCDSPALTIAGSCRRLLESNKSGRGRPPSRTPAAESEGRRLRMTSDAVREALLPVEPVAREVAATDIMRAARAGRATSATASSARRSTSWPTPCSRLWPLPTILRRPERAPCCDGCPASLARFRSAQARQAKRGARMWWWLVTAALALMVWIYCLFMLDPAMLP
jgi:hypothetical protein